MIVVNQFINFWTNDKLVVFDRLCFTNNSILPIIKYKLINVIYQFNKQKIMFNCLK